MKHILTAALLTMSAATFAQHKQQHADPITSHSNVLNLSADQRSKLDSLQKSHRATMAGLKNNDSVGREARQQQMQELQKQHREQSLAILNADQAATLEKIRRDEQGARQRKMKGNQQQGMNEQRLQKQLNLTDEQVTKMKAMQEKNAAELKQLQKDSSVTEANKKIRMAELRKNRRSELESILTPEQQKKFKEMRGPRGKSSASE